MNTDVSENPKYFFLKPPDEGHGYSGQLVMNEQAEHPQHSHMSVGWKKAEKVNNGLERHFYVWNDVRFQITGSWCCVPWKLSK